MSSRTIAIVGDVLLDRSYFCAPKGVSPEAPIISMNVDKIVDQPGGAANVALNVIALNQAAKETRDDLEVAVQYVGPIPELLWTVLCRSGKDKYFHFHSGRATRGSVKNRIVFEEPYQQLIRFDEDGRNSIPEALEEEVISYLSRRRFDVGIVSDYNHGAITPPVYKAMRSACNTILVDPKGTDPYKYPGADVITPNASELVSLTQGTPCDSIEDRVNLLRDCCANSSMHVIYKNGKHGCVFFPPGESPVKFPPYRNGHAVIDPMGAGDTFIATLAFWTALGLTINDAIDLATAMAGISVTRPGCFVPDAQAFKEHRRR